MSQTCIILSKSACMNSPGMLHVAMFLFYFELKMQDRSMYSVAMVIKLVSFFVLYTLCFLPSMHPWT